jgi:hypothetical protein
VARGRGGAYYGSGWRGDLIKRDLRERRQRPVQVSAWAFDAERALALPLDVSFILEAFAKR